MGAANCETWVKGRRQPCESGEDMSRTGAVASAKALRWLILLPWGGEVGQSMQVISKSQILFYDQCQWLVVGKNKPRAD